MRRRPDAFSELWCDRARLRTESPWRAKHFLAFITNEILGESTSFAVPVWSKVVPAVGFNDQSLWDEANKKGDAAVKALIDS